MPGWSWRVQRSALLWAVLTAIVLLVPAPVVEESVPRWVGRLFDPIPWIDKLGHGLLFLLLTVFVSRSLARSGVEHAAWAAGLAAALYGLLLEAAQIWVPGRAAEPLDGAADVLGAVVGAILAASGPFDADLPSAESCPDRSP